MTQIKDVSVTKTTLAGTEYFLGQTASGGAGSSFKIAMSDLATALIGSSDQFDHVASFNFIDGGNDSLHTNFGAAGLITGTLPAATANSLYIATAFDYTLRVSVTGTDTIGLGLPGGSVNVTAGTTVVFACLADTLWSVVSGTLASRVVALNDTGAVADSGLDETGNVQQAFNAGLPVSIPDGTYKVAGLTLADDLSVAGFGPGSELEKNGNGPVITIGNDTTLSNFAINANGAAFTGAGIAIPATAEFDGYQRLTNLNIIDATTYCVEYTAEYAGFASLIANCRLETYGGLSYAVKWGEETASNHHGDRSIIGCYTNGQLVDASSSQAGVVLGCISGGAPTNAIGLDADSAKIAVIGNRLIASNQSIAGTSHMFLGNVMSGNVTLAASAAGVVFAQNYCQTITLASGASNCVVAANAAQVAVIDNSGTSNNWVDIKVASYTPAVTATTTAPDVGAVSGKWTRHGQTIHATVAFTFGAGIGVGTYYFSLPHVPSTSIAYIGPAQVLDAGTRFYVGVVKTLLDGTARCQLIMNDSGAAAAHNNTAPHTWAVNDEIHFTISYNI